MLRNAVNLKNLVDVINCKMKCQFVELENYYRKINHIARWPLFVTSHLCVYGMASENEIIKRAYSFQN